MSHDNTIVFSRVIDGRRCEERRSIGNNETMRVRYGFDYIGGNRRPHFSVTADIFDKRGIDIGGGCCHDLIAEHFPEIARLIRWHLVDDDGTPMHYIANGIYWMQKHLGIYRVFEDMEPSKPQDLVHFKSTTVFGAVASDKVRLKHILASEATVERYKDHDDVIETRESKILRLVGNWLRDRRLLLREAMKADIARFPEIKYITQDEINETDHSGLKRACSE